MRRSWPRIIGCVFVVNSSLFDFLNHAFDKSLHTEAWLPLYALACFLRSRHISIVLVNFWKLPENLWQLLGYSLKTPLKTL